MELLYYDVSGRSRLFDILGMRLYQINLLVRKTQAAGTSPMLVPRIRVRKAPCKFQGKQLRTHVGPPVELALFGLSEQGRLSVNQPIVAGSQEPSDKPRL